MLSSKKKVVIKSKGPTEPTPTVNTKKRGRPAKNKTIDAPAVKQSLPSSRVYNLGSAKVKTTSYIVNNIVQLNINIRDIRALEKKIIEDDKSLIKDIENSSHEPSPWNDQQKQNKIVPTETTNNSSPFKSIIRRGNINIVTEAPTTQIDSKVNRKDLIINSGVKRSAKPIMNIYNQCWPSNSTYACWYCCNKFNTTPVGIPQIFINNEFHCYGNFCSYNCAKRYLRPQSEDDLAMLQTSSDICVGDDLGEKPMEEEADLEEN